MAAVSVTLHESWTGFEGCSTFWYEICQKRC